MNKCKKALEYVAKQNLNSFSLRFYSNCMTSLWIRWYECHGIIVIKEMSYIKNRVKRFHMDLKGKGHFVSSLLGMTESPFKTEMFCYYGKFYESLFIYHF